MQRAPIRRRVAHGTAGVAVLLGALSAAGFVRISFEPTSPGFHWASMPVPYVIQAAGSQDVADRSEEAAVRMAFQRWEAIADSSAAFYEDPLADATRADFDSDDIHMVLWDEDGSSGLFPPGSGVLALTPILATLADGRILDADIVFNGAFTFTTDPGSETSRFDVQSIATHEAGHMLGFDHAGGPMATMFTSIPAGSTHIRALSCDEESAAAAVYPAAGAGRGSIVGRVTLGGAGVQHGHVIAVDALSGEYAAATISDADGRYRLAGLLPGSYLLFAEPLDGPLQLEDTIAFAGEPATDFGTTAVATPVAVTSGGSARADFTVGAASGLSISGSAGRSIEPGETAPLVLFGAGLNQVAEASVTGGDVTARITGRSRARLDLEVTASPTAAPGARVLVVRTSGGEPALLVAALRLVAPAPSVTGVSPAEGVDPAGGEAVTVTGTGFATGSQVVIGGRLASSVTVDSATRLRCEVPPAGGEATTVDLVVVRPDGREARRIGALSYSAVPRPTAVDPAIGSVDGGSLHRILGSGLFSGCRAFFGAAEASVTAASGDALEVVLPPGAAGTVDVRVVLDGEEGVLRGGFTYVDGTPPQVTSIDPTSGPTRGGTRVTVRGSGFSSGAQVTFGGAAAATSFVSANELVATTPAHAADVVDVRVRNPETGLETISPQRFTYTDALVDATSGGGGGGGGGCGLAPDGGPARTSPGTGLSLALLAVALLWLRGAARRP